MRLFRILAAAFLGFVLTLPPTVAVAAQGQPPQQDGFVPVSDIPVQDQLPAAPLLIAAYVFVLAALFFYVASLARRLGAVKHDVERLEAELARQGKK